MIEVAVAAGIVFLIFIFALVLYKKPAGNPEVVPPQLPSPQVSLPRWVRLINVLKKAPKWSVKMDMMPDAREQNYTGVTTSNAADTTRGWAANEWGNVNLVMKDQNGNQSSSVRAGNWWKIAEDRVGLKFGSSEHMEMVYVSDTVIAMEMVEKNSRGDTVRSAGTLSAIV